MGRCKQSVHRSDGRRASAQEGAGAPVTCATAAATHIWPALLLWWLRAQTAPGAGPSSQGNLEREQLWVLSRTDGLITTPFVGVCVYIWSGASQVALVVRNPPADAADIRDAGLSPGLGRSPGGGHGNPLHYSFLENPKDRGAWWATVHGVTKSQIRLK